MTGPGGFNQSGSEIFLRKQFNGLQPGLYAFSVRSDARASAAVAAVVNTNVSTWETVPYTVLGDNDAPGEISIEEVSSTLRGPNWKGGTNVTRTVVWEPSSDTAVDGYDWIGSWSHVASTGSTTKDARRIPLGDIPAGKYTVTVYSTKRNVRGGSRNRGFEIVQRSLEPPQGLTVTTRGNEEDGWKHGVSFDEPETGRLVTGYEYRVYEFADSDNPPTVWPRTGSKSFDLTGLDDGEYRIDVRTYDSTGSSDHVTTIFKQPPEGLVMEPPPGLTVIVGEGTAWDTADATWRAPSEDDAAEPDEYAWALSGPTSSEGTTSDLSVQFTGLAAGDYSLNVRSTKEGYDPSEPVGATFSVIEPAPDAPTNLRCADGASRTQKIVTWTKPSGGTEPDGYVYAVTGATTIPRIPLTVDTLRITLDLDTGKSTVTVSATKGELESEAVSTECTVAATKCKPPRSLTATQNPASDKVWTMRWQPPELETGDPQPTGYDWELSGARTESGKIGVLSQIHIFNDLTQGTYGFRVRTKCGNEDPSDWTPTKEFSVEGEPIYAPEGLTVTQDEDADAPKDVTLEWTQNDEGRPATGYEVRLTGTSTVDATAVTSTSHVFQQLAAGSYTVYVRATVGTDKSNNEASTTFDVSTPGAASIRAARTVLQPVAGRRDRHLHMELSAGRRSHRVLQGLATGRGERGNGHAGREHHVLAAVRAQGRGDVHDVSGRRGLEQQGRGGCPDILHGGRASATSGDAYRIQASSQHRRNRGRRRGDQQTHRSHARLDEERGRRGRDYLHAHVDRGGRAGTRSGRYVLHVQRRVARRQDRYAHRGQLCG